MKRASRLVTLVFAVILRATMGEGIAIVGAFSMSKLGHKYRGDGPKFYPKRF